jgi:glycosyltransferase involved in cell wall biosynthesis
MNIIHIISSLNTGGAEKLLLDSIPFYVKKGIAVDLLLLNNTDTPFLRRLKALSICNIYSLGKGNVYNPLLIFKIIPFLKKYDIIHAHLFPALYWVALAKLLSFRKILIVYTEHNTHNKRRNKIWMKPFEKIIYRQYSKIICISEPTKIFLSSWIGLNQENNKLTVIHNGIDLLRFEAAIAIDKKNLGISENFLIMLMNARFSASKDQNTLIKAFALLSNENMLLIFAGDGILRQESEKLAKELGIENKVMFLGIREDIPELIKAAYICVLSSHWEGFGIVAAEYMACGKPAIVSDVEGLRDVVGNAGLLFESGNVYDLKEKIELLLNDEAKYKEISIACQQRYKEFSIEKMVDLHINLYEKIISQNIYA